MIAASVRYVYDDGDALALVLTRQPMGWRGLRQVGLMQQLSRRQTPMADGLITTRWDVPRTWLRTTLKEDSTYLHSVLALA